MKEGGKKEKGGRENMTISKDFILRKQIRGGDELPKWVRNQKLFRKNGPRITVFPTMVSFHF